MAPTSLSCVWEQGVEREEGEESQSKCCDTVNWGLILCLRGNGSGGVGPIQTVYRDLELRSEDRWELEQMGSLAPGGRAERSHRTEGAPEVDVGQQRTGSQQQSGSL